MIKSSNPMENPHELPFKSSEIPEKNPLVNTSNPTKSHEIPIQLPLNPMKTLIF